MTAAKTAKAKGLKSLSEMSEIANKPRSTLYDWFATNPQLFDVVVLGCIEKKRGDL